jgi:nicotinate phosphoribosyltransferase
MVQFPGYVNTARVLSSLDVRCVAPGEILFAGQPIADVAGPFAYVQSQEIAFEHAFDLPMTVASRAMDMKAAAEGATVMDFSLRRNGDADRALQVAYYSYLAGFDQTSNGDAANELEIPWAGTVAHYWQQLFFAEALNTGKHFQQLAFEKWLDANAEEGTVLLLDTISTRLGMIHAANAALSTPERLAAFRGFRIDSGRLSEDAVMVLNYFQSRGIDVRGMLVILTGDLDRESIAKHRSNLYDFCEKVKLVFGVGTKLIAETDRVAGVIFKMCEVDGQPVQKGSNELAKATLPGKLQIFRGVNERGNYVGDVTGLDGEEIKIKDAVEVRQLLQPWSPQSPIPTTRTLRDKIFFESKKFGFFFNYPTSLSPALQNLRREINDVMQNEVVV